MSERERIKFEVMHKARNLQEAALLAYSHEHSPYREMHDAQYERAKAELLEVLGHGVPVEHKDAA